MDKNDEVRIELQKIPVLKMGKQAEELNLVAREEILRMGGEKQALKAAIKLLDDKEKEVMKLLKEAEKYDHELKKALQGVKESEKKDRLHEWLVALEKSKEKRTIPSTIVYIIKETLNLLKAARNEHKRNEAVMCIRTIPIIIEKYSIARKILESKKGGSNCKRRKWAELVADKLNKEYPHLTKNDAWKMIPSSANPLPIYIGLIEYEIFREREELTAVDTDTQKESIIKKETFFNEYYKKRK